MRACNEAEDGAIDPFVLVAWSSLLTHSSATEGLGEQSRGMLRFCDGLIARRDGPESRINANQIGVRNHTQPSRHHPPRPGAPRPPNGGASRGGAKNDLGSSLPGGAAQRFK